MGKPVPTRVLYIVLLLGLYIKRRIHNPQTVDYFNQPHSNFQSVYLQAYEYQIEAVADLRLLWAALPVIYSSLFGELKSTPDITAQ